MKKKYIIISSIIVVLVALGVAAWLNRTSVSEQWTLFFYRPSDEVAEIEDALQLTDEGQRIFHLAQPVIEDKTVATEICGSRDENESVLGCYAEGKIHMYRPERSDLQGIQDITAAHELLHAAWARLSEDEQQRIGNLLTDYYNNNAQQFRHKFDNYDTATRIEELHAHIGTEVANLPSELEEYYAQYFENRGQVVNYYNMYRTTLLALQDKDNQLIQEAKQLKDTIDAQTAEYQKRDAALSEKITAFNQCVQDNNCAADQTKMNAQSAEITTEQKALEALDRKIQQETLDYNNKMTEYNKSL